MPSSGTQRSQNLPHGGERYDGSNLAVQSDIMEQANAAMPSQLVLCPLTCKRTSGRRRESGMGAAGASVIATEAGAEAASGTAAASIVAACWLPVVGSVEFGLRL